MELAPGPRTAASELVARSAAGDERAFTELARRHREGMVSAARQIVGPDAADDVVQQALIESYRDIGRGARPQNPGPWLRGIVRNRARDELRARLRQPVPPSPASAPSTHEVAEQREVVRSFVAGVAELTELQRGAIVAQAVEGKSHEEIADEHGTSAASVRMAIARARGTLRRRLGALAPLPLLEVVRRAAARLRDVASGGAGVGAGAATLALVAVVSAVAMIGPSSDREKTGGDGDAHADVSGAEPPGQSLAGQGAGRRPRSDAGITESSEPNGVPRPGGPAAADSAAPSRPAPAGGQPDPASPPPSFQSDSPEAPQAPPGLPQLPSEPPEVPDPAAPPASPCGPLSQLVPCVVELVDETLDPIRP